jgi:hypothetical protein
MLSRAQEAREGLYQQAAEELQALRREVTGGQS